MAKHQFTNTERYTVFVADGSKCFWCGQALLYRDVQVEHVFPERLENTPELEKIRADYGLGADFQINSFSNWVTSHQGCNLRKGGALLPNCPQTLFTITSIIKRAPRLEKFRAEFDKDTSRDKVLAMLKSALDEKKISEADIKSLFADLPVVPVAASGEVAIRLSEVWQLIVPGSPAEHALRAGWGVHEVHGNVAYVSDGKVGGVVPNVSRPDISWQCSRCGNFGPWNGVRCMSCGNMEEPD